jgi:hypothetical protein
MLRAPRLLAVAAGLIVGAALLAPPPPAWANERVASGPVDPEQAPDGSLLSFVELVAAALEARATAEAAAGPVRLEATASRGIDAAKVERAFLSRLKRRLRDGAILVPASDAALGCRITISEEGNLVWAIASLEGGALPGPTTVAVSAPVDRELEATLGATVRPAQTRFVLERLGAVPSGVLDAALVDVDADGADELALLGVDGLRFFRAGQSRLERVGNVHKLPERRWPRVPVGWLARTEGPRLWGVTSAGHFFFFDIKQQRFEAAPTDLVPFRGAPGGAALGPLAGAWRYGSPVVALPLLTSGGAPVKTPALPGRVRDLASVADGWIYVDEQGQLLSQRSGEPPTALASERIGDRIALADLDGDGDQELVTTSASAPGEPDHLVLRRLARDLSTSTVAFRSPLSGGSIVATAVGKLDYGNRLDIILIEEVGKEALAWRLRFAP